MPILIGGPCGCVRAMCSMLVLGFSVNKCLQSSGTGNCFFSNFLLFRIMCVRYLIVSWEKDSISLWIWGFVGLGGV